MSKGYKKEYIDKVKIKFNDTKSINNGAYGNIINTQDDTFRSPKSASKLVNVDRAAKVS
jgi:hypothetical protein